MITLFSKKLPLYKCSADWIFSYKTRSKGHNINKGGLLTFVNKVYIKKAILKQVYTLYIQESIRGTDMTYMQPRASMSPIGRQPFRPGQWQGFKGVSNHTTYIQNNFYGNSMSMNGSCFGNYNNYHQCYNNNDSGSNKLGNWMMGIGAAGTLLGGILKLFSKDKPEEVQPEVKPEAQKEAGSPEKEAESPKPAAVEAKPQIKPDTLKVEKKDVKTTTGYTVQHGDTWANLIMGKYKDENGNPISFSDAKELWTQLKQECGVSANADGMPSSIEFPNEFKNYKYDPNGETVKNTNFENDNYKAYDGGQFEAKKTTNYTATGTINGKSIGTVSGSGKEVTNQLKAQGFTESDIKTAMEKGEVKITKQKNE